MEEYDFLFEVTYAKKPIRNKYHVLKLIDSGEDEYDVLLYSISPEERFLSLVGLVDKDEVWDWIKEEEMGNIKWELMYTTMSQEMLDILEVAKALNEL